MVHPKGALSARALGTPDAAAGLSDLAASLGATMALRDLGLPQAGVARAADAALQNPSFDPRPRNRAGTRRLIAAAWEGSRPDSP